MAAWPEVDRRSCREWRESPAPGGAIWIFASAAIVQHTSDADEHLIEVPRVSRSGSSPTQPSSEVGTELSAPKSDALMRDHHATLGQDQLDVTQTEAEDVIPLHRVTDDLGRQPMPRVGGRLWRHSVNLARLPSKRQSRLTCNAFSPDSAAIATRALKSALCCFLFTPTSRLSGPGQPTAYPAVQKTGPPQTKAGLVGWPVRDLVLLPRDVVAAIPVSPDRASIRGWKRAPFPIPTGFQAPMSRSIHHAGAE